MAQLDKPGGVASGAIVVTEDLTAPFDCVDGTQMTGPLTLTPLAQSHDQDGDGCSDWEELGDTQGAGGLRDPFNVWDLMDQYTGSPLTRDRAVAVGDIGAVVARFGAGGDPAGDPGATPSAPTGYHVIADRSGSLPGGSPWNLAPPDGTVSVGDIGAVVGQFGHSCVAAP